MEWMVMALRKRIEKAVLLEAAVVSAVEAEAATRKKRSLWAQKWMQRRKMLSFYSLIFEKLRSEDEKGSFLEQFILQTILTSDGVNFIFHV